jgi:hypothetical protein
LKVDQETCPYEKDSKYGKGFSQYIDMSIVLTIGCLVGIVHALTLIIRIGRAIQKVVQVAFASFGPNGVVIQGGSVLGDFDLHVLKKA